MTRRFWMSGLVALALVGCDDEAGSDPPAMNADATVPAADMAPPPADMAPPPADMAPPPADMAPPPADMGPPPMGGPPGSACGCDAECEAVDGQAGVCVLGVCMVAPSAACGGGEVAGCPEGFQCWSLSGGAGPFCWPDCDHIGEASCAGACDGDGSCAPADGNSCDAACSTYCGGSAVTGDIGGACEDDSDCGGATCYLAEGWVEGYCLEFGCGDAGAECGSGGLCISGLADDNVCMGACDAEGGCRPGYRCAQTDDGNICFAGCGGDEDCPAGMVCNADEICVVDFRCSPARPVEGECPAGQLCVDGACEAFACAQDGPLEPNEDAAGASPVDAAVEGLQICADDHDWFRFSPTEADVIYQVGQHSQWGSGDLDATLVDADGAVRDQTWLLPDGYHDENPRGPMDLEIAGLVGHPDAADFFVHVFGSRGAVNAYDLFYATRPYRDGPDCEGAGFTQQECRGITPRGTLDVSQYMVFPAGHDADPYIGNGVFFASGLSNSNTPTYVPSSAHWARREMVMAIRHAIHVVQETYPGTGPLGIGEISMRDGSTPNGHPNFTHYYGANVDLAYYIREEAQRGWGNLVYRPICSDKARLSDWSDVDTDGRTGHYGECVPGSDMTHIVDIPRTALLLATMCGTGRVRVFGVDTSIEAQLKTEYRRLRDAGTITPAAYTACMRSQASANDDGSWVWHFNHSHVSFCAEDCPDQKADLVERLDVNLDWTQRVSLPREPATFTPAVWPREVAPR
ncbi:MAG: hypothetical protein H6706_21790 [Myxococcales bacterium]|nr:hypothetical protein [Myxococcales bacterium]